ncbi:MAG TPA: CBS domain-containing protein [Gemmatimonadales bacterium]|nr:CBS domain-containing protein [Gemmatimonadales bacterium]
MTLADLLSPRRVVVPLLAATLEEGLRVLVDACVADGRVGDAVQLDQAIRDSWPEDTVSLGPHAWLPHFRTDAVPGLVVALGIADGPIAAGDRDPGGRADGATRAADPRMILLIVAPPRASAVYLQTVAAFARLLARPEVARSLVAARSPAEVLALPALRQQQLEGQLLVRDVMRADVVALRPDDSLEAAARQLERLGVGALPVTAEGGQLVGMLSHRELLRLLAPTLVQRVTAGPPPEGLGSQRVRDAMARTVLCVSEDQTLADAAHLLTSRDVERVPVVADGILKGFLTRADLVRRLLGSR